MAPIPYISYKVQNSFAQIEMKRLCRQTGKGETLNKSTWSHRPTAKMCIQVALDYVTALFNWAGYSVLLWILGWLLTKWEKNGHVLFCDTTPVFARETEDPRQTSVARTVSVFCVLIRTLDLPFAEYTAVVQTAISGSQERRNIGRHYFCDFKLVD
jgi:hypothetical protein